MRLTAVHGLSLGNFVQLISNLPIPPPQYYWEKREEALERRSSSATGVWVSEETANALCRKRETKNGW